MHIPASKNAAFATSQNSETLRLPLRSPTYASIPAVREDIRKFLLHRGIDDERAGMLLFDISEILTNLIKHPLHKAEFVEISLSLQTHDIEVDVADNSTPFATFDAKCKEALAAPASMEGEPLLCLRESGFGLACILRRHEKVYYIPSNQSGDGLNHFHLVDTPKPPGTANASGEEFDKPPATLGKTVFLIDDDPVSLSIHQQMLQNIYRVIPFDNADAALAAFDDIHPQMVISDLNMPGKDGIRFRRELSQKQGGDATPFIFLSGHHEGAQSAYVNHIGIDDYLTKPIKKERLLAVMARLFNRSTQYAEAVKGHFHRCMTDILKPQLPRKFGSWKIITLNAMADAGGGDFALYEEKSSVLSGVLGDVMGHGQQAKFFTYAYAGYIRSIFRTLSHAADGGHMLEKLSQWVDDDVFLENTMVTCLAFDLKTGGEASFAAAGHPPPLLISRGAIKKIDVAGPLPGLAGESHYTTRKVQVARHDRIIMATDGFFSLFQNDISEFLHRHRGEDIDSFAGSIWIETLARQENMFSRKDDATLIIAEYGG